MPDESFGNGLLHSKPLPRRVTSQALPTLFHIPARCQLQGPPNYHRHQGIRGRVDEPQVPLLNQSSHQAMLDWVSQPHTPKPQPTTAGRSPRWHPSPPHPKSNGQRKLALACTSFPKRTSMPESFARYLIIARGLQHQVYAVNPRPTITLSVPIKLAKASSMFQAIAQLNFCTDLHAFLPSRYISALYVQEFARCSMLPARAHRPKIIAT
jgi:hypothetical protein